MVALLDIGRIQWQFERIARGVDIAAPWTARDAAKLDSKSMGDWLRSVGATATSRDLMAIMARVTWGAEPDEVSMLHAVRYVKAAGGIDRMLDVVGGAQQDHFPGGTQQIADKMAADLGDRVRLDAAVSRIEWSDDAVAVTSTAGVVEARRAIVAIPPAHRLAVDIAPAPPIEYQQLAQRWPQGALSKAYAVYRRPFWRDAGHSGQALSDEGPVFITFDVSPGDDGPGVLLGFVDSRDFDALPPEQRREKALKSFTALFGVDAENPIEYLDHCWGAEPFAPGRADGGGAAGIVDPVRPAAAQARRSAALGRHRDRRRMDRLPGRRGPLRAARGRRGGRSAQELMRRSATHGLDQ